MANVPPQGGRKHPEQKYIAGQHDNILFICGGTFSGIEEFIARRLGQQVMGFHHEARGPAALAAARKDDGAHKDRDALVPHLDQKDLVDFGLIPEFVGRLPVIAPMRSLTRDEIVSVMTEPKNAMVKQYQAYFEMEDCQLEFEDDALEEIARIAMERETGVRALRSLFEQLLLDVRYELPVATGKKRKAFSVDLDFVQDRLQLADARPARPTLGTKQIVSDQAGSTSDSKRETA